MNHLPVHPTKRHPHTGAPLRAIFVRRDGRVFWPMLGGDDTVPTAEDKAAAEAKAAEDDAAAKAAEDARNSSPKEGEVGYFPAATPRASMTPEQQIAYDAFHGRKHEGRAKEWSSAFPGKTAAEIKEIVDAAEAARRNTLTLDEKTLEDAKAEARKSALADAGPKAVKSAFDLLLGDMPQKDKDEHLDVLDLSKFLTDDHEVDTVKVRAAVARIQPDKGQGKPPRDYGQGTRSSGAPAGSVAAIVAERRAAREKK